jgi:pumilio family protein 6
MATKSAAVGDKRKSAPSGKYQSSSKFNKKPRLDERKVKKQPVKESEDSDEEDGGADLSEEAPQRSSNGAGDGKTFERSMLYPQIPCATGQC